MHSQRFKPTPVKENDCCVWVGVELGVTGWGAELQESNGLVWSLGFPGFVMCGFACSLRWAGMASDGFRSGYVY